VRRLVCALCFVLLYAPPARADLDGDGVEDALDLCLGDDALGDEDHDHICADRDLCLGDNLSGDADVDGVCNDRDLCRGSDASGDADRDGWCAAASMGGAARLRRRRRADLPGRAPSCATGATTAAWATWRRVSSTATATVRPPARATATTATAPCSWARRSCATAGRRTAAARVTPDDELDLDGDGFFACAECDDSLAEVHPGGVEVCDGYDNDCDGARGPGERDDDGDGRLICESGCDAAAGVLEPSNEVCGDGLDNNCNGEIDDGCSPIDEVTAACAQGRGGGWLAALLVLALRRRADPARGGRA
jgi:hypothetical protein